MTVDNILSLFRKLTHITSDQVDDSDALDYANIIYHDLENAIITEIDEDYFWDTFTTDLVNGQNEYVLPESDATTEGIKKITRVEVKRDDSDDYYTVTDVNTLNNFGSSKDWLETNQEQSDGFFDIKEGSIFLYPEPDENVTDGVKLYGTISLIDLQSGGAESTIFPSHTELRQFHHVIAIGMQRFAHKARGQDSLVPSDIEEYEFEKRNMLQYLSNRYNNPIEGELPDPETYTD